MTAHGLPILATLALWWASTGMILHLDSLDPQIERQRITATTPPLNEQRRGPTWTSTRAQFQVESLAAVEAEGLSAHSA